MMIRFWTTLIIGILSLTVCQVRADAKSLEEQLAAAGNNTAQIRQALENVEPEHRAGLEFLLVNMPEHDLRELSSEYLIENVKLAYQAWQQSPWHSQVSEALFLNNILPYASINERRDRWRADFHERFYPLVEDAKTASEAAAILNNQIFKQLNVKYSRKRAKADQSPYESIESGLASCTGLSVILIDACRAVGIPTRFVGTPLWSDRSGNHSWVEIWDDGWHCTGAAEPTKMDLDKGWFLGRASRAIRDEPRHAIYATSFKRTPLNFPCVWNRSIDYVSAVNVTERYTDAKSELPAGKSYVRFQAIGDSGERVTSDLKVFTADGNICFQGSTRDERFDGNDHLTTMLAKGEKFSLLATQGKEEIQKDFVVGQDEQLLTVVFKGGNTYALGSELAALTSWLSKPHDKRGLIKEQAFAVAELTCEQCDQASQLLWDDHLARIKASRNEEMTARKLTLGEHEMKFAYKIFGEKPAGGRSLYIAMHGGGGTRPEVNDRQWQGMQKLYQPPEGVYVAPRAPTDAWDMWHKPYVDRFFSRLIENLIAFEDVNPDRVYVMGYSAGGDGAYKLGPRMADRWAAGAMMAGHPNGASPLSLRNIGFAIYMGGKDGAYKRNQVAAKWKVKLAELREGDPEGYHHHVTIYPEKGHWMDGEDASAIDWMRKQIRDPFPKKIVWRQDQVTHSRFYWLATDQPTGGSKVTATLDDQEINLELQNTTALSVRLSDQMLDLDKPILISAGEKVLFEGQVSRTIGALHQSLEERGDRAAMYACEVQIPDSAFAQIERQ